ncbi:MAG TPA: DUF2232 domain-containing protein [Thermoanaerobaculia bacterium]
MIENTTYEEPVTVAEATRGNVVRSTAVHAVVAALMFVSPLQLFVPSAYIHAGLRNGWRAMWGAILGSVAILAGITAMTATDAHLLGQTAAIGRLLLEIGVPAAIAFWMIRRNATIGTLLAAVIVSSVAGFVVAELVMRVTASYSPYAAIVANFRSASSSTIEFYRGLGMAEEGLRAMSRMSDALSGAYLPALLVSVTALMFTLSLIMIPRLPAGRATGSQYLFRNLAWPDLMLIGFVLGGLAPLASGSLRVAGFNVLAVVAFLYMLQGLAVFRSLLIRMEVRLFGNVIAYTTLVLLTFNLIAPFLLFLGGLFDPFFDFRNFSRKDDSDESDSD